MRNFVENSLSLRTNSPQPLSFYFSQTYPLCMSEINDRVYPENFNAMRNFGEEPIIRNGMIVHTLTLLESHNSELSKAYVADLNDVIAAVSNVYLESCQSQSKRDVNDLTRELKSILVPKK